MVSICKYCSKEIEYDNGRQFGAHLTNCSENPAKKKRDQNQIKRKEYKLNCNNCNTIYTTEVTEYQFEKGNYTKFCSRSCANKRTLSQESKDKIAASLRKEKMYIEKVCPKCENIYKTTKIKQIYCSTKCNNHFKGNKELAKKAGLKSVTSQNRRSKNEIAFAKLCKENFSNVALNEPIFNGWDADIILNDLKIAILWNGKWHYEKITHKHSLSQVQNRDKIKLKEIVSKGYTPYIIKDMGKYNLEKVNDEWKTFNEWLNKNLVAGTGFEPV